ncbi:hypothetical protein BGZ82_003941 [Podila clonocystis]|nr:hypothetical protein BGZ82_003941 [Podila clonocystis]
MSDLMCISRASQAESVPDDVKTSVAKRAHEATLTKPERRAATRPAQINLTREDDDDGDMLNLIDGIEVHLTAKDVDDIDR